MKKTFLLAMGSAALLLALAFVPTMARAESKVFIECFDDDYYAGRHVPDGVDATRSSPFTDSIDACRIEWLPPNPPKLEIQTIDIGSFDCPSPERRSCCGAALGFADGGGTYLTFRYSIAGTIATGSFVQFQVVGYGGDVGQLFKYTSTDGSTWTAIGTDSDAMGNYQFPLPTGSTQAFFRLRVGPTPGPYSYDGIIVDNFRAMLYDTPLAPVSIQEGGGSFCVFTNLCPGAPIPTLTEWGVIILVTLMVGAVAYHTLRRRRPAPQAV